MEFTLIDDRVQMDHFRQIVYSRMEALAAQGDLPKGFSKEGNEDMKR